MCYGWQKKEQRVEKVERNVKRLLNHGGENVGSRGSSRDNKS